MAPIQRPFTVMRLLAPSFAAALIGLALMPALLASGDTPALSSCRIGSGSLEVVLATIRSVESGDDYTARARGSSASGAYQFTDATWNTYAGYARAVDAPPAVQDVRAVEHVTYILNTHNEDLAAVPVVWYLGHRPTPGSPAWDRVPAPGAGNRLTPRQYQEHWMQRYHQLLDGDHAASRDEAASVQPGGCAGADIPALPGGWSLPGPRRLIDAEPSILDRPHHDYPAWDWAIVINTPIYAVRGGTVTHTSTFAQNWFNAVCPTGDPACNPCGIGLTITDADNNRWTYCHGTKLTVELGASVTAGQQILWSGNTGRSTGPHLHLQIRASDGRLRCPQRLLQALHDSKLAPQVQDLPSSGCAS